MAFLAYLWASALLRARRADSSSCCLLLLLDVRAKLFLGGANRAFCTEADGWVEEMGLIIVENGLCLGKRAACCSICLRADGCCCRGVVSCRLPTATSSTSPGMTAILHGR